MKYTTIITLSILLVATITNAQTERSVFRKKYIRIGLSSFGKSLDNSLSPKDNVFGGRYGANTGVAIDIGRIFYFSPSASAGKINYGLDWTIFSATYHKMNQWDDYAKASGVASAYVDGSKITGSIATRLGPVLSFNPVEKLVMDIRFQVAPTIRVLNMDYLENENQPNQRSFSFQNQHELDEEDSAGSGDENQTTKLKNVFAFGWLTNIGFTIRRKAIGLSMDYIMGKFNSSYDATDGKGNRTFGKQKLPADNLQLKLSFTF